MKNRRLIYPFVPKSAGWLVPGQYWALPLSNGTFGCGRVIQVPAPNSGYSRMEFLAGVLDWHAPVEPTSESIAGAACLDQGQVHLRAITRTGGAILGHRDLALDHVEPWQFRGARFHGNSSVSCGLAPVRAQTPADHALPVLSTWGYNVARGIAEDRFVR